MKSLHSYGIQNVANRFLFAFLPLLLVMNAEAKVRLPLLFQDHMVLQRDTAVTIWGWADPGEKITVAIANSTQTAITSSKGEWQLSMGPFPAGGPHQMVIKGSNTINIKDILFGEIWVCAGQSNMQFTIDMLKIKPTDALSPKAQEIRFINVQVDTDIQPATDIKGGYWEIADVNTIGHLSGTAYFFARHLYDSLQVPIGLISSNLGATSIETWMSEKALRAFPQFISAVNLSTKTGKSSKQLLTDLSEYRKTWDADYYLKSPGMQEKWYMPQMDVSDWVEFEVPNLWENVGYKDHDGEAWFRREFDRPAGAIGDTFNIALNQIDDYDIVWLNGVQIGEGFGNRDFRNYYFPSKVLKEKGNVLVVRVFDIGGNGGMYTNAFWGNPILNGKWKFKIGQAIDAKTFPKPDVPNGSIFTHPGLLYNANIAPLTKFRVKGVIWYQGESNDSRGEEYGTLLPALIEDWRDQWKQSKMPFLVVQLANHHAMLPEPGESSWAELRAGQMQALKLPNTAIATAIDIGDALDIHPPNKETLGKRLALAALNLAYRKPVLYQAPVFDQLIIRGHQVVVSFDLKGTHLKQKNKLQPIQGFALAGSDGVYHWADAILKNDRIILLSKSAIDPITVRYAWSDNPGTLNLYSTEDLPVLPFRSDSKAFISAGKVFQYEENGF
ncbi:MAG: sialate O-acetylesterase [Saprospiraceae bacterium]